MYGNFYNYKTLVWCFSDCEYSKYGVCTYKTKHTRKEEIQLSMIHGTPSCNMYSKTQTSEEG